LHNHRKAAFAVLFWIAIETTRAWIEDDTQSILNIDYDRLSLQLFDFEFSGIMKEIEPGLWQTQ